VAANLARLGERMGVSVLPKALLTAGLGIGAAGPVVLHVGVALFTYEPTEGVTYEPTDGATDDPYPESPACASAAVLERAKAVANATVSFIVVSLFAQRTTAPSFRRSLNSSLSAIEAAKLFTSRRVSTLQQPPSIACHSI
jgi:hypothetical protein